MFDILVTLITVFYVIICILMILIILLQAGRGGMGTALGGGASQSVFGGGGSSDILAKITQSCAAGFMIFAMFLAYASAHSGSANLKAKSDENTVEERTAGEDDVVDYEKIGPNPLRLPPRRDPNAAVPTPPTSEVVDTPADAPPADAPPADAPADAPPADAPPADAPPADAPPADAPADAAPTPTEVPSATGETKPVKKAEPKKPLRKKPEPTPADAPDAPAEMAPEMAPAEAPAP